MSEDETRLYNIVEALFDQQMHDDPLVLSNTITLFELALAEMDKLTVLEKVKFNIMLSYFTRQNELLTETKEIWQKSELAKRGSENENQSAG